MAAFTPIDGHPESLVLIAKPLEHLAAAEWLRHLPRPTHFADPCRVRTAPYPRMARWAFRTRTTLLRTVCAEPLRTHPSTSDRRDAKRSRDAPSERQNSPAH